MQISSKKLTLGESPQLEVASNKIGPSSLKVQMKLVDTLVAVFQLTGDQTYCLSCLTAVKRTQFEFQQYLSLEWRQAVTALHFSLNALDFFPFFFYKKRHIFLLIP